MANQKKNKQKIIINAVFIAIILLTAAISIYKYIKYKETANLTIEITLLIFTFLIYIIYILTAKKIFVPETLTGKPLPLSQDKTSKKLRIKSYIIKSLVFASAITIFDVLTRVLDKDYQDLLIFSLDNTKNKILSILILFLTSFIISIILEGTIGELTIKKYDKESKKWKKYGHI